MAATVSESNRGKLYAVVIMTAIGLYLAWSPFNDRILFFGLDPIFWLLFPIIIFSIMFLLWRSKSFMKRLASLFRSKDEPHETIEDPYICFERFENHPLRAMLPDTMNVKLENVVFFSEANRYVYPIDTLQGLTFISLNAVKDGFLLPQIIQDKMTKRIGFDNIKDYHETTKDRRLKEFIQMSNVLDIEKLSKLGEMI